MDAKIISEKVSSFEIETVVEIWKEKYTVQEAIQWFEKELEKLHQDWSITCVADVDIAFESNYEIDEYMEEINFIERTIIDVNKKLHFLRKICAVQNHE